jgi:hypothetical protein
MTVGRDESGLTLSVRGPGTARATYHFKNIAALTMFAEAQEQKLREAGFQLQAYAERRSGRDRRQSGRPASRDRRGS